MNWEQQTGNTPQDLYSVHFASSTDGWVVGDNGIVLHTTNGGIHWEPQSIPPPVWNSLNSVFFISDQVGWISSYHEILFTEDGGENWVLLAEDISPSIHSIFFTDQYHGWAVGLTGQLIYTLNGGHTWQADYSGTAQDLTSVWFTAPDEGWITGIDGTVLHTYDGGSVWTPEFPQEKSEVRLQAFPNPFSGFTTFEYELDKASYVSFEIINNLGQRELIMNEYQEQGKHSFNWNPDGFLPGIYYYQFLINDQISSGKLILLK